MEEILILLVSLIAGLNTYFISCKLKKGAVFGSALTTLISGIVFPILFSSIGTALAAVGACASYAGMIEAKRVGTAFDMAAVSILSGGIFIVVSSAYIGIGGRLGTIAAIACFVWLGIKRIIFNFRSKKSYK